MLLLDPTVIHPTEPDSHRRQTLLRSATPRLSIGRRIALPTSPTTAQTIRYNRLMDMAHSPFRAKEASTAQMHTVVRSEMAFAIMTVTAVIVLPRTQILACRIALPTVAGLDLLQPA